MDDTDRKILRHLQANPLLSMVELADRIGLSHTPCWRRVKRLEADGIIQGRALLLDASKLGFPISVFAELTVKSHTGAAIAALENEIDRHPEIVECFSMSGGSDFLLRVVVSSVEDYEAFLKRVLLQLPEVGSVNSRFALKSIKFTQNLPL